ncbi:hypothetical protein [Sphingomonas sp.]|uniref:hypothetical protein n=1 Tax=Sphingomonas sp. TaxID=28214 RepID=UPI002DD66ADD|nr:hypothetical protein [Sphingomonas sp.]
MIFTVIVAALGTALSTETVPLASIHANPGAYEGKTVETCGDAGGGDMLFLRGWVSGRSRGGFQLDRSLNEQGYVCLRAQVVRVLPPEREEKDIIIMSHPPVIPKGWQLRVLKLSEMQ